MAIPWRVCLRDRCTTSRGGIRADFAVSRHTFLGGVNSRAKRTESSPSRARAALNAGPSSPASDTDAITALGGPGELGCGEAGLALVFDTEGADARSGCLRHREVGADRMEDAGDPRRLAGLYAERHHVLDLELDRVADLHAVLEALLLNLETCTLDAEVLAHQRRESLHRSAELPAEDT